MEEIRRLEALIDTDFHKVCERLYSLYLRYGMYDRVQFDYQRIKMAAEMFKMVGCVGRNVCYEICMSREGSEEDGCCGICHIECNENGIDVIFGFHMRDYESQIPQPDDYRLEYIISNAYEKFSPINFGIDIVFSQQDDPYFRPTYKNEMGLPFGKTLEDTTTHIVDAVSSNVKAVIAEIDLD